LHRIALFLPVLRRDERIQLYLEPQRVTRTKVKEIGRFTKLQTWRNGCLSNDSSGRVPEHEPKQMPGMNVAPDLHRLL
jgi:hypothetical protein